MCFNDWVNVTTATGWALFLIGYVSLIYIIPKRISKEAEEKVKEKTFPEVTILHQRYVYRTALITVIVGLLLIILGNLSLLSILKT